MKLNRNDIIAVLIICFIITTMLSPAALYGYLYHDDWIHYYGKQASCQNYPMTSWLNIVGRPFGGIILCLQFHLVDTIEHSVYGRATSIIILNIVIIGIYYYLRREHISEKTSAIICILVACLPGFLVHTCWLASSYALCSMPLSIGAAILCNEALARRDYIYRFIGLIFLAILLEVIADLIYQTGAMMMLVLLVITVARSLSINNPQKALCAILLFGAVAVLSNGLYFIWFECISDAGRKLAQIDPSRGAFFTAIPGTAIWFFQSVLPKAFKLWFYHKSSVVAYISISIFVISLCLFLWRCVIKKNQINRAILISVLYVLMLAGVAVGSMFPVLVSSFRIEIFRSFTLLSSLIVLATGVHIWYIVQRRSSPLIQAGLFMFTGLVVFSAYNSVLFDLVLPRYAEFHLIKNELQVN